MVQYILQQVVQVQTLLVLGGDLCKYLQIPETAEAKPESRPLAGF